MKKIFISTTAILLSILSLAGCNTKEDATMERLSNELDKTNNSISNVKTLTETDLDMTEDVLNRLSKENKSENIQRNIYVAKNAIEKEQRCKNEVAKRTANIKKYLSKSDLKLAKNQISALKDLSKNLSTYNNSVSYSEKEFNSAIRNYNGIKKNAGKNPERVNAKLNSIACNSNARRAYYENLLNTLCQVEDVLGIENNIYYSKNHEFIEKDFDDNVEEIKEEISEITDSESSDDNKGKRHWFKKNIDTYQNEEDEKFENEVKPNINSDTYAPTRRNIDTYRPYGYNGYGVPYNPYMNGNYPNGMNGYMNPYTYNSNNFNRYTPYVSTKIEDENLDNNQTKTEDSKKQLIKDKKERKHEVENKNLEKIENKTTKITDKNAIDSINEPRLEEFENLKIKEVTGKEVKYVGDNEKRVKAN